MVKTGRTNCEDTLAVAAHGAQGVESTGGKFVGKGEEDYAEAFASGESNKVTSLSFSRVGQETGHLDREEEGSRATNANGFNCIRESAVRGKETWEVFDKVNNGRERGQRVWEHISGMGAGCWLYGFTDSLFEKYIRS